MTSVRTSNCLRSDILESGFHRLHALFQGKHLKNCKSRLNRQQRVSNNHLKTLLNTQGRFVVRNTLFTQFKIALSQSKVVIFLN